MISHKTIQRNIIILSYGISGIAAIIFAKLFLLQIILNSPLLHQSKQNYTRVESIKSMRGNITDRNGILLATNRPVIDLYWKGTGQYHLTTAQKELLRTLEQLLHVQLFDTLITPITLCERRYKTYKIAADISLEQLMEIEERFAQHPNLTHKTHFARHYPFQSMACHMLGYLNRTEDAGWMGLEKIFEKQLQGKHGLSLQTTNSMGRKMNEQPLYPAQSGSDIHTTLDMELQQILEALFPKQYTGAALIMDPQDGDILALISRPDFDPTRFLEPMLQQDWTTLQKNNPFINRALNACYPPGSVFKLITASAALEYGIITPETTWLCRGYYRFGNRTYLCHKHTGHGLVTARQALAQSCNVVFYEIGKILSIDMLANYSQQFGLGIQTQIMFPEKKGLVPTTQWKKDVKGEPWWPGETLSAAIGQSFLLVTPMQVARMISAIFTGYLIQPRILLNEPIKQTLLTVHPETLQFLQNSMKKVVKKGTGRQVDHIKHMHVFAKTSTAQTSNLQKRVLGKEYQEHGWFVSFFQYKDLKPLTLVILVEHAGAARVATRVAKQFLLHYKYIIDRTTTT